MIPFMKHANGLYYLEEYIPGEGRLHFFLKIWEISHNLGNSQNSFPKFPKFAQNYFGRTFLRLRDFGAKLRITFYASQTLFLACLEYVPWAQLHKNTLSQNSEFPKIREISQSLGNFPKFRRFPKIWKISIYLETRNISRSAGFNNTIFSLYG